MINFFKPDQLKDFRRALKQSDHILRLLEKRKDDLCNADSGLFNTLTDSIKSMESMIFSSVILSFISTVNKTIEFNGLTKAGSTLKPFLTKFNNFSNFIGESEFNDFVEEINKIDKEYPKIIPGSSLIIILEAIKEKFNFYEVLKKFNNYREKVENLTHQSADNLDLMMLTNFVALTPYEFEIFVAGLFDRMGYSTQLTSKSGDYGVDIVAEKQGAKTAIQCKKYHRDNKIGNQVVQKLLGAMQFKDIKSQKAIIITTSSFTKEAQLQAEGNPIELWDYKVLFEKINKYMK